MTGYFNSNSEKILDRLLAFHSAPALFGIKCANLFTLKKELQPNISNLINEFNYKAKIKNKDIMIKILCECEKNYLVLVYNQKLLKNELLKPEREEMLISFGYKKDMTLNEKLDFLSERIKKLHSFPHEIGLFLGYPIEDVSGFIENSGKNYIFSGYWKVYSNEENTQKLFNCYTKCRQHLCKKINEGMTIYEALKIA